MGARQLNDGVPAVHGIPANEPADMMTAGKNVAAIARWKFRAVGDETAKLMKLELMGASFSAAGAAAAADILGAGAGRAGAVTRAKTGLDVAAKRWTSTRARSTCAVESLRNTPRDGSRSFKRRTQL